MCIRDSSWSDLENLGYAVSHSERGSSPTEMVSWWEYTGPEPVTLKTSGREQPEVIEAGYQTQKHTKDYG